MVIKVVISGYEVQSIITQHLREKFKMHAREGEYLEIKGVGAAADDLEFTLESKRSPQGRD